MGCESFCTAGHPQCCNRLAPQNIVIWSTKLMAYGLHVHSALHVIPILLYRRKAVTQHLKLTVSGCRFKALLAGGTGPRPALVSLYPDGTVLVTCAGTEMGQGLFTKAKQVSAHVHLRIGLMHAHLCLCFEINLPMSVPTLTARLPSYSCHSTSTFLASFTLALTHSALTFTIFLTLTPVFYTHMNCQPH